MAERILVTGGTGFLGQHLVRALRADASEVRALVRPRRSEADPAVASLVAAGAELVYGDILDLPALRAAVRGVSAVFHLAGQLFVSGVPRSVYEQLHIEGTRNLLTACADEPGLQAIVHCSTTGVLGPTGPVPASEDAPMGPSNTYEQTKAEGERLALELGRAWGLPLAVARPALVYGPGDLHLLGWFRAIKGGYYMVVGRGDNLLHPIYIDDLIDGMRRCATSPQARGSVYNLVGERPVPIKALAAAIAAALGRRLPPWQLPLGLARAAAAVLEALPGLPPERLPLTQSRITFMTESRAYCGCRARDELGFVPRVDLAAGLAHTVAWYQVEKLL